MEAKELRLGNLVWNETQKIAVPVDMKILSEQLYGKTKWPAIPLTEEWLLKLGFKFDGAMYNINECFYISYIDSTYILVDAHDVFNRSIDILFVHQLQNLYFALIGTELII